MLLISDKHNHARQHELRLEKYWITTDCWFRIITTVIGITVTDCWKAYRHAPLPLPQKRNSPNPLKKQKNPPPPPPSTKRRRPPPPPSTKKEPPSPKRTPPPPQKKDSPPKKRRKKKNPSPLKKGRGGTEHFSYQVLVLAPGSCTSQ